MRKYIYAQMLLDVMSSMKRPLPELKNNARAWLMHGASVPDMMADSVNYNGMLTPRELQILHLQLIDQPVGKVRGKADEVIAWIAEEEDLEACREALERRGE